jgi:23S rRNA pseudouridine1911/1915/1917 synthase
MVVLAKKVLLFHLRHKVLRFSFFWSAAPFLTIITGFLSTSRSGQGSRSGMSFARFFSTLQAQAFPLSIKSGRLSVIVPSEYSRTRLDAFLKICTSSSSFQTQVSQSNLDALGTFFLDASRTQVQKFVTEGNVHVNDSLVLTPGVHVKGGQTIHLDSRPLAHNLVKAEAMDLKIVFEDSNIIVVDKPSGLVSHPASTHRSGTLLNGLAFHVKQSSPDPFVKLVHRIDRCTSGLLMAAKSPWALSRLSHAVEVGSVKRRYLALVLGDLARSVVVDRSLARCDHTCKVARVAPLTNNKAEGPDEQIAVAEFRRAVSRVKVLERYDKVTLVEVQLVTGRQHQARAHLASLGHPVMGDELYGGQAVQPNAWWWTRLDGEICLHAYRLDIPSLETLFSRRDADPQECDQANKQRLVPSLDEARPQDSHDSLTFRSAIPPRIAGVLSRLRPLSAASRIARLRKGETSVQDPELLIEQLANPASQST